MKLSVVVTIVEGGASLARCLEVLDAQIDPPDMEVVVPFDDTVTDIPSLAARFPRVRFLPMGAVPTMAVPTSARGQHELFDRRRSAGLLAVTGDIIGILEDRGLPTTDWASRVMHLHAALPHAVIGGAVENGVDRLANWALYFCDFTRYAPPFAAGPAAWVTDVNVSYKRRALDDTRDLWRERYHEPVVHGALARRGETLFLTPELVTSQMRTQTAFRRIVRERFGWGRLFAYTRVHSATLVRRVGWAAGAPLIPAVVFVRQFRLTWAKGRHRSRFLAAAPLMLLLLVCWSAGEAVGYLTGRP